MFSSVNPPLTSTRHLLTTPPSRPFSPVSRTQSSLSALAASRIPCGVKLSNMMMSAPAAMASRASARDWHSTWMRSAKPAVERAAWTAWVMEPEGRCADKQGDLGVSGDTVGRLYP